MKDITRLPKWAQERILWAEARIKELAALVAAQGRGVSDDEALVRVYDRNRVIFSTSARARVVFRLPDQCVAAFLRLDGRGLCISGDDEIVVRPRASNAIVVEE